MTTLSVKSLSELSETKDDQQSKNSGTVKFLSAVENRTRCTFWLLNLTLGFIDLFYYIIDLFSLFYFIFYFFYLFIY